MFDFAFSEIALIGVVALIAIGPKDMPLAIKTVAGLVKKARRMAGEFQTHVDEMVREANLHEVRDSINEIRSMDLRGKITRAIDEDGSIARALKDDPFHQPPAASDAPAPPPDIGAATPPHYVSAFDIPAFVPLEAAGEPAHALPASPRPASPPPAFIPPAAARDHAAQA